MQLYSTNSPGLRMSLKEAIFQGLPPDNGLFMPLNIPKLPKAFIQEVDQYSLQEIAFEISHALIGDEIPASTLKDIISAAISFPAPVVELSHNTFILELFHGPSLAFKDFGAQFMAQLMSHFNKGTKNDITILVATSGDTGGAVATGFYKTPGIRVVILYPSGKVSPLQEQQLTTLGHNIHALEVDGSFDDCQALVKQAFLDSDLQEKLNLGSANSINIARLIPQIFYYWEAYKQVCHLGKPVVFVVPSGNFGNLTAGLIAKKMGLPIQHFVAATNINDVFPEYLESGIFTPRPSVPTLSNAMDVGNPSNFSRILDLHCSTWNNVQKDISGYAFTDQQTQAAIQEVYREYEYILDPHGAIGYLAWKKHQLKINNSEIGIMLETAHPAKFKSTVEEILSLQIEIPSALKDLEAGQKKATEISVDYKTFKQYLMTFAEEKSTK